MGKYSNVQKVIIYEYLQKHTHVETMKKFGISRSTMYTMFRRPRWVKYWTNLQEKRKSRKMDIILGV